MRWEAERMVRTTDLQPTCSFSRLSYSIFLSRSPQQYACLLCHSRHRGLHLEVELGEVRRENAKLLSKLLLKVHPREEKLHLEKNKMKLTHFVFRSLNCCGCEEEGGAHAEPQVRPRTQDQDLLLALSLRPGILNLHSHHNLKCTQYVLKETACIKAYQPYCVRNLL